MLFVILISCNNKTKETKMLYYEKIISDNQKIEDSITLRRNFTLIKFNDINKYDKKIDVIYKILLANLNANLYDKVNPTSNKLYEEALVISNNINENDILAWVNTNYGFYHYKFSDYAKALSYFIQSSKILDENPGEFMFLYGDILKKNAFYFGSVNDLEKEIKYLELALINTPNTSLEYARILNAIGHYYLKTNNLEKAKNYFLKTSIYSKKNVDEIRYAKALGDLASIYKIQKKYPEAIKYLKEDIMISKRNHDDRNTMFAEILLGKVYLESGEIDKSSEILNNAHIYASKKDYLKNYVLEIKQLMLEIAVQKEDSATELVIRRELSNLSEDLSNYNGIDVISNINWQVQKENINYKLEAEIARSEKENLVNKTLLFLSFILFFAIIALIYIYRKRIKIQRSEYENTVLKLQVEKLKSEKKLGETHKTLNAYKTYLIEKNDQIEDLKYEINNIKGSKISYLEDKEKELSKLLKSHLMTEENWLAFKNTFINEKYDYYQYLMDNFPNLTDSNLRIIFLQKLGLSNSETAQLLGVTIDAIKKAKQRLRKKYVNSYEHLFNYED